MVASTVLIKTIMFYQTKDEMLAVLGQGVRAARLAANLSQQETAARSGVSMTALRNLEAGKNASTVTLLSVCRLLRRTDWILGIAPPGVTRSLTSRHRVFGVSGPRRGEGKRDEGLQACLAGERLAVGTTGGHACRTAATGSLRLSL